MNTLLNTQQRPRFAPIRNLTPERLTRMLDAFEQGYLGEAALAWDTLEKRDDTIKSVAPKRKKAIARHGWEVIVLPNLPPAQHPEALRHKAALEYFYTNLTCSNALDANERGGFKLLIRQMMDAVGKRYAVHEILWKLEGGKAGLSVPAASGSDNSASSANSSSPCPPCLCGKPDGNPCPATAAACDSVSTPASSRSLRTSRLNPQLDNLEPNNLETIANHFHLTAEFRFVPLWFFENTTGALRFLPAPNFSTSAFNLQNSSLDLKPGAWMVTTGEGLMLACSVAWMYKALPLQDWLDFSQTYGRPALIASTSAERNSPEWNELGKVLDQFLTELSGMTSADERIQLLDLKGGGGANGLPYERLIARMDRLITALWRGNDLSTLSREQGYGASLQQGESDILEQDDAELISETLQSFVDRHVIEYLFGKGVRPLAAIKILVTPRQSTVQDLAIDQFLIDHGARLAINDTLARYGRAEANQGEPALQRPESSTQSIKSEPPGRTAAPPPELPNRNNRREEIADSILASNSASPLCPPCLCGESSVISRPALDGRAQLPLPT